MGISCEKIMTVILDQKTALFLRVRIPANSSQEPVILKQRESKTRLFLSKRLWLSANFSNVLIFGGLQLSVVIFRVLNFRCYFPKVGNLSVLHNDFFLISTSTTN